MVDLLPNAEEQQIASSIEDFLAAELPISRLKPLTPTEPSAERRHWPALAGIGVFGLGISQELGGTGLTLGEEVLAHRQLGRHLLGPTALATVIAAKMAEAGGERDLAGRIIAGETRASLALPQQTRPSEQGSYLLIDDEGADWALVGDDDRIALYPMEAFGNREPAKAMDWSLALSRGRLNDGRPLLAEPSSSGTGLQLSLLASAELVGIAEAARDMGVAYAKLREQFGQPIGSFQAIKHRCADMHVRTESSWAQTVYAGLALAEGKEGAAADVLAAKLLAGNAATSNAESNIQIHGGIGFTAEGAPHWLLRRAHMMNLIGGSVRKCQDALLRQRNA